MKIKITKEIEKKIDAMGYYSKERFIDDCKTYCKAVKAGRIMYTVTHVSQSGMSRNIQIQSYEGTIKKGWYRNYYQMLTALGYSFANCDIKVSGCGMDMVFHTNYTIIHRLYQMGIINKKQCAVLSQRVNY